MPWMTGERVNFQAEPIVDDEMMRIRVRAKESNECSFWRFYTALGKDSLQVSLSPPRPILMHPLSFLTWMKNRLADVR
jgi:hypothetical protein